MVNVSIHYAKIAFASEEKKYSSWGDRNHPHYGLFHRTMNFLSEYGFTVMKDPNIEKYYKSLSKDHRYGKKGDLEFSAKRYPAGFEIEFYQNINFQNPNGGRYDFDKYDKMPYLVKKQFLLTVKKLEAFFAELGYKTEIETDIKGAEDRVKADFVKCWHHDKENDMSFNLSAYDGRVGTGNSEVLDLTRVGSNNLDRNGKIIRNGEIKYFRDYNGYLARGKVYHRLNMMYWIVLNDSETAIRSSSDLFDLTKDTVKAKELPTYRKVSDEEKEFLRKKEELAKFSMKELEREIKRRKKEK